MPEGKEEVLREIREELERLNRLAKEIGTEKSIEKVDKDDPIAYEERKDKIVLVGDSLLAQCKEHFQAHENKFISCRDVEVKCDKGASLDEISEEATTVKLEEERGY